MTVSVSFSCWSPGEGIARGCHYSQNRTDSGNNDQKINRRKMREEREERDKAVM
jgi:hypothetical protein